MRVIVDTNVFISGVFFSGPPYDILRAWRGGRVTLVLSPEILAEYQATGNELAEKYPGIDLGPWLELVTTFGLVVDAPPLPAQICVDPDDDKFLACAIASRTKTIVSGDKARLATSGHKGISVLTPRQFVTQYLTE